MKKLELYLYLMLTGYLVLVLLVLPLIVKMTVHQMVVYTALPLLAWIVLSVYFLARWALRKRTLHSNSNKTTEKRT